MTSLRPQKSAPMAFIVAVLSSLCISTMATTPTPPPLSPYGTFQGSLFQYSGNLVAFESSSSPQEELSTKKCILIGGLSDGLVPTPYTSVLEQACHSQGWSLVQPILSSSYLGFGNGDLERDSREISALLWYLTCHRSGETFALVGHSTGCQNCIHFLKHGMPEMVKRTKVIALQAPVSDREGAMLESGYQENIEIARALCSQGKQEEMMPRSAFWAPITARRFLDLQGTEGRDDFFSSDLTDDELQERLSHVGDCANRNILVQFSGSDEYVPESVDKRAILDRLCNAMNSQNPVATPLYLENANHNLSLSQGDGDTFVSKVTELLALN